MERGRCDPVDGRFGLRPVNPGLAAHRPTRRWDPAQFPPGWLAVRYVTFAVAGGTIGLAAAVAAYGFGLI